MKKLILSATLALACFTAQAKNEVIKNDDDKNPKNKAKVVAEVKKALKIRQPWVISGEVMCSDGEPMTIIAWGTSYGKAMTNYWNAFLNVGLGC